VEPLALPIRARLSRYTGARTARLTDAYRASRAAGFFAVLPVELAITGDLAGLAPGLDLTAYRIVQEALTNTLKHAGPAQAVVTVNRTPGTLEIQVTDDGCGGNTADGGGRGLPGMRQRARLYGGQLAAGPRPGGGFQVRASLPIASPVQEGDR
jgi:signal transduction histidine kinase